MKIEKKVISDLIKCYSIAPLRYRDKDHFLVAAEKVDRCLMFDLEGHQEEVIWSEPGGVMSMVQVPGSDGQFLATHQFYSPNDSKAARIVIAEPAESGWQVRTLVNVPHVHRFDLLRSDGNVYLIVCALKSGHDYKDDWSKPGKVYAAELPADLSAYSETNQLELTAIKENMLKNHGYCKCVEDGRESSLVTCEEGVFHFFPPTAANPDWTITRLLDRPVSDAVLVDLDQDGEKELCVMSPFHGDQISIYKKKGDTYQNVYDYPEATEFLHAICGGELAGQPVFIAGHRKGRRDLFMLTYDRGSNTYQRETIDEDCGPANVMHYVYHGKDILIAANRESDEVAMYIFS